MGSRDAPDTFRRRIESLRGIDELADSVGGVRGKSTALRINHVRSLIYSRTEARLYFYDPRTVADSASARVCASIRLCGKLLDSFYDRIDVPNGPFFINERTSQRCRAGRKFRICMAMQFARSLEGRKSWLGKKRRKNGTLKGRGEQAQREKRGGTEEKRMRRGARSAGRPSIFIRRAMPQNFQSGRKGNT